jgi:alpha-1,6-mannosyltransferase
MSRRLPASAWPVRLGFVQDARSWAPHDVVGYALVAAGLVVLTGAWLALGRAVRGRPDGVAVVCRSVAIWAVPLVIAPPLFSGDAWSYVAQGYLTAHGMSPYAVPPSVLHGAIVEGVSPRWLNTPAPYGPVTLLWGAVFAHLTSAPWLLMMAQRLLALVGLGILAVVTPRLARFAGRDPAAATWLVVASPFVLVQGVGGAHNDLILAGLVTAALLATVTRPGWVAGAALGGLAAAVKLPGSAACVGVVLLSLPSAAPLGARLRRSGAVAVVAVAVVVALGLVGGLGIGWLGQLGVPLVDYSPLSVTTDLGWALHLDLDVVPLSLALSLVRTAGLLCALAVMSLAVLRGPTGRDGRVLRIAAVVLLVVTVLSPVSRSWYFFWCLPVLACCVLPPRQERALVGGVLGLGLASALAPPLSWGPAATAAAMAAGVLVGYFGSEPRGHHRRREGTLEPWSTPPES